MKKLSHPLIAAAALAACSLANAGMTRETPDALIYTYRPIESFTPAESIAKKAIEITASKQVAYLLQDGRKILQGAPMLFTAMDETPVTLAVKALAEQSGAKLVGGQSTVQFLVRNALTMDAGTLTQFMTAQSKLYEATVLADGNPANMATTHKLKSIAGGLMGLAAMGIGIDKMGANFASGAIVGTAIGTVQGTNEIIKAMSAEATPNPESSHLATQNWSGFRKFEVRQLTKPTDSNAIGQIIIAYREENPTDEVKIRTLAQAILQASGINSNPTELERARAAAVSKRFADYAQFSK